MRLRSYSRPARRSTQALLKLAAALLLGCAAAAQAQTSSLKPAAPAEIVAGVSACVTATRPGALDEAALTQAGWQKGSLRSGKGKTVSSPLSFYGREGSNAMLLTNVDTGTASCTVMARIERIEAAPAVVQAISSELKVQPKRNKSNDLYWFVGQTVIGLVPTGQRDKPSLSITVMQLAEKK